jgi:hypothetical protein
MSLFGNLADVAVVDLLQFVHLSGRSGTLHLESDDEQAHISFHRGRIVGAWGPTSPSVCLLLIDTGALTAANLERAQKLQAAEVPTPPLGHVLVANGMVAADALREAITRKVERTVYDLVTWSRGSFRFSADEIRADQEIALAPGDVIPQLDINTQMVLMEALRLFDEKGRDTPVPAPGATASDTTAPAIDIAPAPTPSSALVGTVQIVSPDRPLAVDISVGLRGAAHVRAVSLREAGIPAPGEPPPLVVIDCRPGGVATSALARLHARHPRSLIVAIVPPPGVSTDVYAAGAAAALPPDAVAVAACCRTLLTSRPGAPPLHAELNDGLARLRRVIGDIRGGLLSATMSLNLMTIVADSVERAVLFVLQRNSLVALGAFGARADDVALATTTRGLALSVDPDGVFAACMADGRARVLQPGGDDLPSELRAAIDAPRSGQAVLFPVLGSRRVIAVIYADNGRHLRSIDDVEIVEIASAQVGLAFENELLRRQLERAPASGAR